MILDWNAILPEPIVHECNCGNCDHVGELEDVDAPLLLTMVVAGVSYVTDRFLAIRADLAPIPDGYEGPTQGPIERHVSGFMASRVTAQTPDNPRLRQPTVKALEQTGWKLRVLTHADDVSEVQRRTLAVVTPEGEHIGWAIAQREAGDG